MKNSASTGANAQIVKQRLAIIYRLEAWLEIPMVIMSLVWFYLMIVELVWGLSRFGERLTTAIWIVFILDFFITLIYSTKKTTVYPS